MDLLKTFALFVATALAEIVGCYLPYLWLKQGKPVWLLLPAAASLGLFAWLLTLHPTAAGRVYAAYGGVYVGVAMVWLWAVDRVQPTRTDWIGVAVCLVGMAIIIIGLALKGIVGVLVFLVSAGFLIAAKTKAPTRVVSTSSVLPDGSSNVIISSTRRSASSALAASLYGVPAASSRARMSCNAAALATSQPD